MKAVSALQPLIWLIVLAILLIVLVTVVRLISAGAGFLVERQVVFLAWLAGLVIASAAFAWIVRRSMRRDASSSGLVVMTVTVLAIASPLALMFLEHPSP